MEKRPKFITTLILLATVLTVGILYVSTKKVESRVPVIENEASEIEAADLTEENREEILSPNGENTLVVENSLAENGDILQSFSIVNKELEIIDVYQTESNGDRLLTVPYNTFSPDNKYVFLAQKNEDNEKYIVLRTDGNNIKDDQKFVEVTELFYEKYQDFKISEITGWGGVNLLVINTDNLDASVGPSFWFDLSNFGFIRLSHRFN